MQKFVIASCNCKRLLLKAEWLIASVAGYHNKHISTQDGEIMRHRSPGIPTFLCRWVLGCWCSTLTSFILPRISCARTREIIISEKINRERERERQGTDEFIIFLKIIYLILSLYTPILFIFVIFYFTFAYVFIIMYTVISSTSRSPTANVGVI